MNTANQIDTILEAIQNGDIDVAFNEELNVHACIIGNTTDYTARIIDCHGDILCETEFRFDSMLPPSAEEFIQAWYYSYVNGVDIMKAVVDILEQGS